MQLPLIRRAADRLKDSTLLACYDTFTPARRESLLDDVRAAAITLARLLETGGVAEADVRAAVRGVVERAYRSHTFSNERVEEVRPTVEGALGAALRRVR